MAKPDKANAHQSFLRNDTSRLNLFQLVSHGGAILEPRQPRYFQTVDFREVAFVLEQFARVAVSDKPTVAIPADDAVELGVEIFKF